MIIACPECKREVSDRATMCPHCGFDFQSQRQKQAEEKAQIEARRNQIIEAERQREYDLHFLPNRLYLMAPWPLKPFFRPFVFAGRSPRIEFGSYLAFYIISVIVSVIVCAQMGMKGGEVVCVYIMYGFVCLLSCFIRRYHDAIHVNYNPATYLIALICLAIPGIGWVVTLWLLEILNPSQEGSNKYGANPFTYYYTKRLEHPDVKSSLVEKMNHSTRDNNALREFEWRRFTSVEKIQASRKRCMSNATYANYYNSAPTGAKEYIDLLFYVSVYPDAMDEDSYAKRSGEVLRSLGEKDIEYLISCETDIQMREVFMTRLSEIRKVNNRKAVSQKGITRQKSRVFHVVLKWFCIGVIGVITLLVVYLIVRATVTNVHKGATNVPKGEERNNLEVTLERLKMLESKYGVNSIEYIKARIDLIRNYTLKINRGNVAKHRAFMEKVKDAGYAVTVMDYNYGVLVGIGVHNCHTGESGTLRMFDGSLYRPHWISEAYAMAIWEHFHDKVVSSSELDLANTERLLAELEAQLCVLRTMRANNNSNELKAADGKKACGKVQLWEDGPYWADRNIGAENPWDDGYHFWWGDTVGYKYENGGWVASDGSDSGFLFESGNKKMFGGKFTPFGFNGERVSVLRDKGWIVSRDGINVLTPNHDAAHVQWGGEWRMPTEEEMKNLCNMCDWTWTEMNGVKGAVVRGKGAYASAGIFLPAAGQGRDREKVGHFGNYWSSSLLPEGTSGYSYSPRTLLFKDSRDSLLWSEAGYWGCSIRPVQCGVVMQDGTRGRGVMPEGTNVELVATNEIVRVGTNDMVTLTQTLADQRAENERKEGLELANKKTEHKLKEEAEVERVQKTFEEVSNSCFPLLKWSAATRMLKKIEASLKTDGGKKALASHLRAIEGLAAICHCLTTESKGLTFKDGTEITDSNETFFRLCQFGYNNGRRIIVKETLREWKDFLGAKESVVLLNQLLNKLVLERCEKVETGIAEKRLLGSALLLKYFYRTAVGCDKFILQLWDKSKKLRHFNDAEIWEIFFSEYVDKKVAESSWDDLSREESPQERMSPTKNLSSFCGHRFGEKYLPKRMTREMWQEGEIAIKPVQTYYRKFRRLELGYAIDGKQLCMMRLYAQVSRETIEKEFQDTKLDVERRFNMKMESSGHAGDFSESSVNEASFEDYRYRVRLWLGTGEKFGIWLEIIDKLMCPSN